MKLRVKILIVVVLGIAVVAVLALKKTPDSPDGHVWAPTTQPRRQLPRLLDLGKGRCIPCKQMMPVLQELRQEYTGRLRVEYIDITENSKAAEAYSIRMIPTQIFFSADGKELWRHDGFISKEDILARWRELGVDLSSSKP